MRAPRSPSAPRTPARSHAELDALEANGGERRLAELAPLEEHIGQRGPVEVTFAHPAVAEDDPLERRVTKADQIDPALVEGDVPEPCLSQVGARQPAAEQLRTVGRETKRAFARPVQVGRDDVDQIAEGVDLRRVVVEVGGIRRSGRLGHSKTIGPPTAQGGGMTWISTSGRTANGPLNGRS